MSDLVDAKTLRGKYICCPEMYHASRRMDIFREDNKTWNIAFAGDAPEGGLAIETVRYCPFCGKKFPK